MGESTTDTTEYSLSYGGNQVADNAYLRLLKGCLTGYLYPESSYLQLYPTPGFGLWTWVRRIVLQAFEGRGFRVFKVMPFEPSLRENGADWPSICYSMIGLKRMDNLQGCIETVLRDGVPGDFIETGVWRGGACILMRAVLKVHNVDDRDVWLADSFRGLPPPSLEIDRGYDLSGHRYMAVGMEAVRDSFRRFDLLDEHVKFLQGWFKDTLPSSPIKRLAVLRLDGDLYESTMDVLTSLYDRLSPGGFAIVDDYHTWPNCRRAVDEFRAQRGISDPIQEIDGSAVFWRRG